MKLLLGLVIAVLAAVTFAQRPSATLEPMDWSTTSILVNSNIFQVATKKDLLVYLDVSNMGSTPALKRGIGSGSPVMTVRRRNAEGVYVPVGNFTQMITPFASTNGKWVVLQAMGMVLFSVDSNNSISEGTFIPTYGGYVLSDDTFVGFTSNDAGNYTISTYQYEASNNTWNNILSTELIISTSVSFNGDFATYRASDTHLVVLDATNTSSVHVQIYSRQADKSWTLVESVPVNNSFALSEDNASVNYNGVDTLVLSTNEYNGIYEYGFMFVYTKSNGQWIEQTFTTSSVGYRPRGNFGTVTTFLDANTLLVTASEEGYADKSTPNNVGKVLVMTRNNNGMWEPTLDFNNPTGSGVWGSAIGVNDHDIIIPNVVFPIDDSVPTLTFYTAPRCFLQPINVTCADQQVSDCSQLDVSSLYTINNAQCGLGAVTATVESLSLVNNKAVQAQFSFSRSYGQSVSCNATVTCPIPPVTVVQQQPSPSKVSSAVVLVHSCLASVLLGFILLLA